MLVVKKGMVVQSGVIYIDGKEWCKFNEGDKPKVFFALRQFRETREVERIGQCHCQTCYHQK